MTTSKELTTKASSNSEALFFVLPLRVSAGRVVRQRQRDRLEKKKKAITRLLSQVVVRLAESLRKRPAFWERTEPRTRLPSWKPDGSGGLSRECIEIQLGKKKNGDTRLLSH